ncbi:MAG: hypothetical protein D6706_11495 [Chloroflexi bacterium]|nr:MAG: hypothetical protein D6706_11495 [Chloroflexota bacterium]
MAEFGEALSERELEVLRHVAQGASNKEIAQALSISQNTVKVHLRNVYVKLGASSRTEAMRLALQQGVLEMPGQDTAVSADAQPDDESLGVASDTTFRPDASKTAESQTASFPYQRFLLIIGVVVVGILIVSLIRMQALNNTPTPEPFSTRQIGDTRWFQERPLPEGRYGMAVTAVGLRVYEIGGQTTAGITNAVSIYDTTTHTWQAGTAKPTPVTDATAAVLFGEIYVPGGRTADGQPTSVVEVYSPANNAWRPVTALPQPIAGGLAISDGSFLYLFGGWDGTQYLDTAFVYDPGADSWRPIERMPQPRVFAAGAAVAGQLYVVGGFDGEDELDSCHYYDVTAEVWVSCPPMLQARAGAGATVLLNKLYVFGGGMTPETAVSFSEFYDPTTETWQVVNTPMLQEVPAWAQLGVAIVETQIYVLGGRRGEELVADNFVYRPLVYQTFIPAASGGSGGGE